MCVFLVHRIHPDPPWSALGRAGSGAVPSSLRSGLKNIVSGRERRGGTAHLLVVQDKPQFPNKTFLIARVFERHKSKALGSTRLSVNHDSGIDNLAVGRKKLPHGFCRRSMREPAHEIPCISQMFFPRYCPLGINLRGTSQRWIRKQDVHEWNQQSFRPKHARVPARHLRTLDLQRSKRQSLATGHRGHA